MGKEPENLKNVYLEQVKAQQQQLEVDLRAKRGGPAQADFLAGGPEGPVQAAGMARRALRAFAPASAPSGQAVDVRISGFLAWQAVVVPPNAYVVHTRRDHPQPLHIGLGLSFRYNPYKDSFLVVPSTMQTILINAYCICKDLQGLLVQGYVQWIIAEFGVAYKKLDFSDTVDPMRVVTIQLREQAEAAIKDKVSTMGIDEVLSDKQPIIAELTARLRQVAEGEGHTDKGLGLRIVTVQVKEAVVSSTRLWENLQKPFRSQRAQIARLAELLSESVIQARELEHENARTKAQLENEDELAALRGTQAAETFDREQVERDRRHKIEADARIRQSGKDAEVATAAAALDRVRAEKKAELDRLALNEDLTRRGIQAKAELALEHERREAANRQTEVELGHEEARQKIRNEVSPAQVQAQLIDKLPAIAQSLPKPNELRSLSIGTDGAHDGHALSSLVAQVVGILDTFRARDARPKDAKPGA